MGLNTSEDAPFGSTVERFGPHGVHPKWRNLSSAYNLGPGSYDVNLSKRTKSANAFPSLWKRHYYLQRQAELVKSAVGAKDDSFKREAETQPDKGVLQTSYVKKKSFTKRGPIDTLAERFPEWQINNNPGAGTYGVGGNPYTNKEAADRMHRSASSIGMMSSKTSGERNLPTSMCALGPGTYKQKEYLNELLNKTTGRRGPYDLFTGPRSRPVISETPDPGAYEIKSFLEKWSRPEHGHAGKFRKLTEQLVSMNTYGLKTGTSVEVGPGRYDPALPQKKSAIRQAVPFLSKSSRYSGSIFSNRPHPVGPGRYDIERYDDSRCIWGAMSAFDSQTPARPDLKETQKIRERLRPLNIPPHRRVRFLNGTMSS